VLHALCENCSKTVEEVHEGEPSTRRVDPCKGRVGSRSTSARGVVWLSNAMRIHKREREMGFE